LVLTLGIQYEVLKRYHRKGIYARMALIQSFLNEIERIIKKSEKDIEIKRFKLNDDEVLSVLQIGIVSHIMMFIEDLGLLCKGNLSNDINFYKNLDANKENDLGMIIGNFFKSVNRVSDNELKKILGYTELENFAEFLEGNEKLTSNLIEKNLSLTREFFERVSRFRNDHIAMFRRYKHAGFPIILRTNIPEKQQHYNNFEFMSIAFTSKELEKEVTAIPFSYKAVKSYESISKDIFTFLGNIILAKLISIERRISGGIIPTPYDQFNAKYTKDEKNKLDIIWKNIEKKHPQITSDIGIEIEPDIKYLEWYKNLESFSKRIF